MSPLCESFRLSRFDSLEGSPSYRNDSVAVRLWPRHFLRIEELCFCWTCTLYSVCFSSRRFGCAAFCNTACTVCSPWPQQHPLFDLLAFTVVCLLAARPSSSVALTHPSVARCGRSCCTTTAMTPPLRRGRPGGCRNVPTTTTSSRGGEEQRERNKCVFVEKHGEIWGCCKGEGAGKSINLKQILTKTQQCCWHWKTADELSHGCTIGCQTLHQSNVQPYVSVFVAAAWAINTHNQGSVKGRCRVWNKKSLWRKNMSVLIRLYSHLRRKTHAHSHTLKHIPDSICLHLTTEKVECARIFTRCAAQSIMNMIFGQVSSVRPINILSTSEGLLQVR